MVHHELEATTSTVLSPVPEHAGASYAWWRFAFLRNLRARLAREVPNPATKVYPVKSTSSPFEALRSRADSQRHKIHDERRSGYGRRRRASIDRTGGAAPPIQEQLHDRSTGLSRMALGRSGAFSEARFPSPGATAHIPGRFTEPHHTVDLDRQWVDRP